MEYWKEKMKWYSKIENIPMLLLGPNRCCLICSFLSRYWLANSASSSPWLINDSIRDFIISDAGFTVFGGCVDVELLVVVWWFVDLKKHEVCNHQRSFKMCLIVYEYIKSLLVFLPLAIVWFGTRSVSLFPHEVSI